MGKNKKKVGKGTAAGLSAAATLLGGQVVKEATKQLLSDANKETVKRWIGGTPAQKDDVGYRVLKCLRSEQDVTVAELPGLAKAGLVETLEALQALRRVRMIQYGPGRRTACLTDHGRDALRVLKRDDPGDAPKRQRATRSSNGSGE